MNTQFKKGVLELLVLALVDRKDFYGFELVSEISKDVNISEGTIYPLLKRLKDEEYLSTYLVESPGGAPRKYYQITLKGRRAKTELENEWNAFIRSVQSILGGTI